MIDEKANPCRAKPFVLKIFCADGDPNGIRIINKSNWSGQGLVIPRTSFLDAKNNRDYKSLFEAPGVYILIGPYEEDVEEESNGNLDESVEEDDKELIYIGEGDPVRDRLDKHYSSKDKDFWTWCIFFVGEDLNKAHIQYLEASLFKYASDAKKAILSNDNEPTPPNLSIAEKAVAEGFLAEMLSIFPIVDLNIFQKATPPKNCLYINKKGVIARGYETQDGFVVLEGSKAVLFGAPNTPRSLNNLRKKLTREGVLITKEKWMEFAQDYAFRTPARAAGVILGQSAARSSWGYLDGTALNGI